MIEIHFEGLDELIRGVEKVSSSAMSETAEDLAIESVSIATECFSSDEDPYGSTWAPWKWPPIRSSARPHVKLMVDTGSLSESIDAIDVSKDGFTLGSFGASGFDGKSHAHFHQEGTSIMPPRKFIPDDRGLPPTWFPVFVYTFESTLRRLLF